AGRHRCTGFEPTIRDQYAYLLEQLQLEALLGLFINSNWKLHGIALSISRDYHGHENSPDAGHCSNEGVASHHRDGGLQQSARLSLIAPSRRASCPVQWPADPA